MYCKKNPGLIFYNFVSFNIDRKFTLCYDNFRHIIHIVEKGMNYYE